MKNNQLLSFLSFLRSPKINDDIKLDYLFYKFNTNNFRIIILASVLFFEQLLLGILVAGKESVLRYVYFISAIIMLLYIMAGIFFYNKRPGKIRGHHQIYEISFAFIGIYIAVFRILVVENGNPGVPAVYMAVLYGVAVIFVFNLWQGVVLYGSVTIAAVILMPYFNSGITVSNYRSDIITNGIIAWVVLFINYRRFQNAFIDKKHIEEINLELHEKSIRDGLTGLYNRRKLDEVFQEVCLKAERYKNDFAVIMMDIDHFKDINDRFGHSFGDVVLTKIARILENNIREVDVCGRWGGEEFQIICHETEMEAAGQLAERLRLMIEEQLFRDGIHITASFGVSSWSECGNDSEKLIETADSRLYQAKADGRNRVNAGQWMKST